MTLGTAVLKAGAVIRKSGLGRGRNRIGYVVSWVMTLLVVSGLAIAVVTAGPPPASPPAVAKAKRSSLLSKDCKYAVAMTCSNATSHTGMDYYESDPTFPWVYSGTALRQ